MRQEPNTFVNAGTAAITALDRWSWWRQALKDETTIGKTLPIHPGEYELGYYRTRSKGGQWEPVAIYPDDESRGDLGFRNGKPVTDLANLFSWSCRNPISYEAYVKALDGGGFEDEPPAPIGDNSGDVDPFEALRIEYLGEKEQAEEFMKSAVTTQAQADKVAIWSKRLADIAKRADANRVAEKEPHLKASRVVDDKWRDLKEEPDTLSKRLKAHIKPYLQEQIRAEEERQRKALEAEHAKRAAEQAERHAAIQAAQAAENRDQDHINALIKEHEQVAQRPIEVEARKVNAGRTGARVGIRVEKVGHVVDYQKAAAALVAMRHKDILAVIDQLAQRAAKAGIPFDGMEVREEEKVV